MDCQTAQRLISGSSLIRGCDRMRDGLLRIETVFEYPGNEYVDLYVRQQDSPEAPLEITDSATTVAQLLGFGLDLDSSPKRRAFVRDVCEQLGVRREGGELVVTVPEPVAMHFGRAAVRLSQACVRIADLIVTYSTRLTSTFDDEIEEGLGSLGVHYERGFSIMGRMGREVKVDYLVHAPRVDAAVLAVSAKSATSAKPMVNAALRKWVELSDAAMQYQFVTLLDSRQNFWTEADRGVLEDHSMVFDYPAEAGAFRELVTNE